MRMGGPLLSATGSALAGPVPSTPVQAAAAARNETQKGAAVGTVALTRSRTSIAAKARAAAAEMLENPNQR
eukprot:12399344-Karenia_brevis.AAC.1